jgi:ATP-dependent DNA helicase MPH1
MQLQRIGRTGRKRDGYVHVLLAEGREESNWDKANEQYNLVQDSIVRSEQLELYADVERLLPDNIKPEPLEMIMEVEEYEKPSTRRAPKQKEEGFIRVLEQKRKRNDDVKRNMPPGAVSGFVSVKDLIVKQSKKRKKVEEFDPEGGVDDDTDKEIEGGLHGFRRTQSTPGASKSKKQRTASMRSEGTIPKKRKKKEKKSAAVSRQPSTSPDELAIEEAAIDLNLTNHARLLSPSSEASLPQRSAAITAVDSPASPVLQRSASPSASRARSPASRLQSPSEEILSSPSVQRTNPDVGPSSPQEHDISWLVADSEDEESFAVEFVDESGVERSSAAASCSDNTLTADPKSRKPAKTDMLPPEPPYRLYNTHIDDSLGVPEPTLPVRTAGKRRPNVVKNPDILSSSPLMMPPPSQRRLRREPPGDSVAPAPKLKRKKKKKVQDTAEFGKINPWIEVEATHSGDDMSEGSSIGDFVVESEGDRQFLEEHDETQVSPSYQQTQIYRQSLLSQAPTGTGGPVFAKPLVRRGGFGIANRTNTRFQGISSSPQQPNSEDEYELGTFVVDDDAEISYFDDSSQQ